MELSDDNIVYIFLDEGGNLDFSVKGSKYFSLTCVTMLKPFDLCNKIMRHHYSLLTNGVSDKQEGRDHFHCTYDTVSTRKGLFEIIKSDNGVIHIDALLVEKRKTHPSLRKVTQFYPRMLGYLIRHIFSQLDCRGIIAQEIIIITDRIPLNNKQHAVKKSIKLTLAEMINSEIEYNIYHHASKAHYGLQIADYCNWAIFRKWEHGDSSYKKHIDSRIKSEFDIFYHGNGVYY